MRSSSVAQVTGFELKLMFVQNAGIGRGTIARKLEQIKLATSLNVHLAFVYVSHSCLLKEIWYKVVGWTDLAEDGDR